MTRTRRIALAAILIGATTGTGTGTGCATIATGGGGSQTVTVTSNPPGATVLVDGQPTGATPAKVALSRTSEHRVELQAPGYTTTQITIAKKFNPWLLGNVVFGGLIGVVVDVATDSTYRLTPNELNVQMQPASPPLITPEQVRPASATQPISPVRPLNAH